MGHKIGRNDPCPCGSGKKYKKCCLLKDEEKQQSKIDDRPAISRKDLYNNKDYDDLNMAPPFSYDQEVSDDDERPSSKGIADQYTCRQFEREIPDIGGDQQKIIKGWFSQYKKIPRKDENNPSLIKVEIPVQIGRSFRTKSATPLKGEVTLDN